MFNHLESFYLKGNVFNPYAGKNKKGEWQEGYTSIDFLNRKFSEYDSIERMKQATEDEGIKLFLDWLAEEEKLQI